MLSSARQGSHKTAFDRLTVEISSSDQLVKAPIVVSWSKITNIKAITSAATVYLEWIANVFELLIHQLGAQVYRFHLSFSVSKICLIFKECICGFQNLVNLSKIWSTHILYFKWIADKSLIANMKRQQHIPMVIWMCPLPRPFRIIHTPPMFRLVDGDANVAILFEITHLRLI
jgi:hypothetical protein